LIDKLRPAQTTGAQATAIHITSTISKYIDFRTAYDSTVLNGLFKSYLKFKFIDRLLSNSIE
jgi:hypothetical protein